MLVTTTEVENDEDQIIFDSRGPQLLLKGAPISQTQDPMQNDVILIERARRFAVQADKWDKGGKDRNDVVRFRQFGRYIKELRQALHLSRQQLAAMAQVEAESLFLLEKGMITKAEIEELLPKIACPLQSTFLDLRERLTMPPPDDSKGEFR